MENDWKILSLIYKKTDIKPFSDILGRVSLKEDTLRIEICHRLRPEVTGYLTVFMNKDLRILNTHDDSFIIDFDIKTEREIRKRSKKYGIVLETYTKSNPSLIRSDHSSIFNYVYRFMNDLIMGKSIYDIQKLQIKRG